MRYHLRKSLLFTGVTFGLSYVLLGLFFALGGRWVQPNALAVSVAFMFTPMAGALLVQRGICRESVVGPLGITFRLNRWFLAAWLLPAGLALAALGVGLLMPDVRYTADLSGVLAKMRGFLPPEQVEQARRNIESLPVHPFWLALAGGLAAGATVNAVAAFGEELGWRGLLQRELAFLGFWRSSLVIGVVWGLWHAPLILLGHNYPQHPRAGVLVMIIFAVALAPIVGYLRLKAGSVIAAAIAHGALNGTFGLSVILLRGGSDLTVGLAGVPGIVVCAAVSGLLYLRDPRPAVPKEWIAKEAALIGSEAEA